MERPQRSDRSGDECSMPLQLCTERFAQITKQLDRVIELLEGNGNVGLKVRVDRIEQRGRMLQWIVATFAAALTAFVGWLLRVYEHIQ